LERETPVPGKNPGVTLGVPKIWGGYQTLWRAPGTGGGNPPLWETGEKRGEKILETSGGRNKKKGGGRKNHQTGGGEDITQPYQRKGRAQQKEKTPREKGTT